ncbi:MAG: 3-phosphoserine/phosphohydroxythreonine transaminase [Armatimonadetes bacterium]|nr:3-phosphoserine/phosphohydroxythreonine transaminase [Armatimonadota bacterium]
MALPYERIYNFSAGPCALPVEVLEEARDQIMNSYGAGMSVMEMSHRSKAYERIIEEAEADLRTLFNIPANYKVLFLQGGATFQFSQIPIVWLAGGTADYVVTGAWGKKALEAAALEGCANKVFDAKDTNYNRVPKWNSLVLSDDANYVHFTSNETIQGVQFQEFPKTKAPLICDMSSDILSRPVNVSDFAVIYAGAQKNMGPAGVTVVIIREDMLEKQKPNLHPSFDYKLFAENGSMYNTPPCWSIYMCGLVYKYLLKNGGIPWIQSVGGQKSKLIYDAIDNSGGFYKGHAEKDCRSPMNITFTLPDEEKSEAFLKGAKALKLDGLKGHRSVGGMRASVYNYFPLEGCQVLAQYMADFAKQG